MRLPNLRPLRDVSSRHFTDDWSISVNGLAYLTYWYAGTVEEAQDLKTYGLARILVESGYDVKVGGHTQLPPCEFTADHLPRPSFGSRYYTIDELREHFKKVCILLLTRSASSHLPTVRATA